VLLFTQRTPGYFVGKLIGQDCFGLKLLREEKKRLRLENLCGVSANLAWVRTSRVRDGPAFNAFSRISFWFGAEKLSAHRSRLKSVAIQCVNQRANRNPRWGGSP